MYIGDIFVLDRGYRDSQEFLRGIGIQVEMPAHLGRRSQLTTAEANSSRLITKCRWIVQSRNGHIKMIFKIFRDQIPNVNIPHLKDFLSIACAIINKYHLTINMQDATEDLAREMLLKSRQANVIQQRVEADGLLRRHGAWEPLDENQIPHFPILNIDDLRNLTFGVFQLRLSPSYIQYNTIEGNNFFEYDSRLNDLQLVRIRVKSRHRNTVKYQLFISFNVAERQPILEYYCTCRSGARTVGMCCHVASIVWFLAYARHQLNVQFPMSNILDHVEDTRAPNRNDLPEIII